jgi:hypothetical protein
LFQKFDTYMLRYFEELELLEPDGLVVGEDLDRAARIQTKESYPFRGLSILAGCYLIFDQLEFRYSTTLNPIYAGRSGNLSSRLREHWCLDRNNVISAYHFEFLKSGKIRFEERDDDGSIVIVEPTAPTCFAIWLIDDERERMLFEHELIYKCRPLINKA